MEISRIDNRIIIENEQMESMFNAMEGEQINFD